MLDKQDNSSKAQIEGWCRKRRYLYAYSEDPRGLQKAYKKAMHLYRPPLFPLECGDM